jgi:hypothetical protein
VIESIENTELSRGFASHYFIGHHCRLRAVGTDRSGTCGGNGEGQEASWKELEIWSVEKTSFSAAD